MKLKFQWALLKLFVPRRGKNIKKRRDRFKKRVRPEGQLPRRIMARALGGLYSGEHIEKGREVNAKADAWDFGREEWVRL